MLNTPPDVTFTTDADELPVLSVVLRLPSPTLPNVTVEFVTLSVLVFEVSPWPICNALNTTPLLLASNVSDTLP